MFSPKNRNPFDPESQWCQLRLFYSAISLINVKTIETIQVLHVEITMILLLKYSENDYKI